MDTSFDVFLSHNSKDKPAVRELAVALRDRGLRVWLDEWELVPGRPWQEALEAVIRTTQSSAVLVGRDGIGPWADLEMRACLNQFVRRRLPVIPVLLPGAPGEPELPFFLDGFTWVDLRGGLTEEGLDRLEWGIRGKKPNRPKPPKTSDSAPGASTTTSTLGRSVADFIFNFNGINGTTGEPLYPPASLGEVDALARGARFVPQQTAEAIHRRERRGNVLGMGGMRGSFNPRDLASSGWGVIFPQHINPEIREALAPLVELRRRQAAVLAEHRFRELAYRPAESKRTFLQRFGVGPGPADPDRLPYYLLLVGTPEEIPWSFQHHLAVQYAVGRLFFDTAEEYSRYAETVVAAEAGRIVRPRRVALFGPRHDRATEVMADHLIEPLRNALSPSCSVETILAGEATKERLAHLLGGDETPALLFTAQHGMGFPAGDPQQLARQGALLCQPDGGQIGPDVYLAGDDVAETARPEGLVAFFYAAHSMGTPQYDPYPQQTRSGIEASAEAPRLLAPQPFVAHLPRRLLGHPAGGALALIGYVERTWGYSFLGKGAGFQTQVFENTLKRLLDGCPIGAALEPLAIRLGELAAELTDLQLGGSGESVDPQELVRLWAAYNDARTYALLGDPAVRLPSGLPSEPLNRQVKKEGTGRPRIGQSKWKAKKQEPAHAQGRPPQGGKPEPGVPFPAL